MSEVQAAWGVLSTDHCSKKFEVEKLSTEDVEMEDLNFYYADYSRYYTSTHSEYAELFADPPESTTMSSPSDRDPPTCELHLPPKQYRG